MIAKRGRDRAWGLQAEPGYETAAAAWTEMLDLLAGFDHQEWESERRVETVHQAYKCVNLRLLYDWLSNVFGAKNGVKLWGQLNFIARPILDCRLLRAIATREPLFRRAKISLLSAPPKTVVDSEHVVDIFEAWEQLGFGTLPKSITTTLQSNVDQFKEAGHQVKTGDNFWSIQQQYGIAAAQFNRWNPMVGSSCESLWQGYFVCVAV
jgi:hypothetical protein